MAAQREYYDDSGYIRNISLDDNGNVKKGQHRFNEGDKLILTLAKKYKIYTIHLTTDESSNNRLTIETDRVLLR